MSLRVGDLFNSAIDLKMVSEFDHDKQKQNRATVTRRSEMVQGRRQVFYQKKYLVCTSLERRELSILHHAQLLGLQHVVRMRTSRDYTNAELMVDTEDAGLRVADWCGIRPIGVTPIRQHCLQEVGQFLRLTQACLRALKELHEHGIRHLDIKFDNICLPYTKDQNDDIEIDFDQIKLIDFDTALLPPMPLQQILPLNNPSDVQNYQSQRLKDAIRSKDVKRQDSLGFDVDLYALGHMLKRIMSASLGYPASLSPSDQRSIQQDIESIIESLLDYNTQHCDTTQTHERLLQQVGALLQELKSVGGSVLRYAFQIDPHQVCRWDRRADYTSDHIAPIIASDQPSATSVLTIEPTDMEAPIPVVPTAPNAPPTLPKSAHSNQSDKMLIALDVKPNKPVQSDSSKPMFKRIANGFLVMLGVVMLVQIAVVMFWPDNSSGVETSEQTQPEIPSAAEPAPDYSTWSYDELRTAVMASDWLKTGEGEPPAEFAEFLLKNSAALEAQDRQAMLDRALLLRYGRGVDVDLEQSQTLLELVIKRSLSADQVNYRQEAGQALRDYGFDTTWADLGDALVQRRAIDQVVNLDTESTIAASASDEPTIDAVLRASSDLAWRYSEENPEKALELFTTSNRRLSENFSISEALLSSQDIKDQQLMDLIFYSESLDNDQKQYWFDINPSISTEQKDRLYEILHTEKVSLMQLEKDYIDEVRRLQNKHDGV